MAAAVGLIFVVGNGLFLFGPKLDTFARYFRGLRQGGPELAWALVAEALVIAVVLWATFRLYARKQSFL